eukprot:5095739-Pyramimonas_sp.AAC.1
MSAPLNTTGYTGAGGGALLPMHRRASRLVYRLDNTRLVTLFALLHPPPHLQGRAGSVDIQSGPQRFRLVVGYYPPRVSTARRLPHWRITAKQLTQWIKEQVDSTPAR